MLRAEVYARALRASQNVKASPTPAALNLGVNLLVTALATCMCAISREDSVDSIQHFFPRWLFLIKFSCSRAERCSHHYRAVTRSHNFTFSLAGKTAEPPCCVAAFVVNSEPHNGAPPSGRSCVGLIILKFRKKSLKFRKLLIGTNVNTTWGELKADSGA